MGARQSSKKPPPLAATAGAVVGWLRNAPTAGSLALLPDVLHVDNPAFQGTAAARPTSNADGSITYDGGDDLSLALISAFNSVTTLGVVMWFNPASVTGAQNLFFIGSIGNPDGASANKFLLRSNNATLQLFCYSDGTNGRLGTTGNVLSIGTPVCVGAFFNGGLGAESDRAVITVGTTAQVLTFSNIALGGAVTSLTSGVTGNIKIGSRSGQNLPILVGGKTGRNLYIIGSAMSGVTTGLLASTALAALVGFEPLT